MSLNMVFFFKFFFKALLEAHGVLISINLNQTENTAGPIKIHSLEKTKEFPQASIALKMKAIDGIHLYNKITNEEERLYMFHIF